MRDVEDLLAEASGEAHLFAMREERKYVVTTQTALALRHALGERLALEQFVPGRTRSRVYSIYFDSAEFALYRESLADEAGLKFRLRTYADPQGGGEGTLFFECKLGLLEAARKKKRKLRCALTPGMVARLIERGAEPVAPESQPKFWRKAMAIVTARRFFPRLTICYEREAFVSEDGRLRVTLDEGYRASRIGPDVSSSPNETPGTLPGQAILEVKLLGEFPAWLADLLGAWGVPPEGQSFSKYKAAVPMLYPDDARLAVTDEAS